MEQLESKMDSKQLRQFYRQALREKFPNVMVKNEPHERLRLLIPKTDQSPNINPNVTAVREFTVGFGLELKDVCYLHPYCDVYLVSF